MDHVEILVDTILSKRNRRLAVEAANVEEVVRVMERLREIGRADWFRGQIINWPKLVPSTYRESVDFDEATNALNRFFYWAKHTPGLEETAQSADALIAIAQHYGLPTTFIDFTTEPRVAGYFASASTSPPAIGTASCIYYLDTEEADEVWGYMPREHSPIPARLILDIPNLWRLEAQGGVFVWCPFDDLNEPYPIDRIVFPYQGPIASPVDAEMYPEEESPLEARLREFFQGEEIVRGREVFKQISTHVPYVFHQTAELFTPENFVETPTAHKSWAEHLVMPWYRLRREHWSDVQSAPSLTYRAGPTQSIEAEAEKFNKYVLNALVEGSVVRESRVIWRILIDEYVSTDADQLNKAVQRVWDEMTRLPWNNQDIARALTATFRLSLWVANIRRTTGFTGYELEQKTIKRLEPDAIWIEFGGRGPNYSRAWVRESDLLGAVREDFTSLLRPAVRKKIVGHSFNTLIGARSPSLLFDFQKLSQLFPTQIIPSQAVFYPEHPLYATPARLHVIGPT